MPSRMYKDDGRTLSEDIHRGGKKQRYTMDEHLVDDVTTRSGKTIQCSLVTIAFTTITVCVLLAAAILMTYYIPRTSETASQNKSDSLAQRLLKGRLPKTVLPKSYEVNLRPFLYEEDVVDSKLGKRFTFDGWVRIKVECIQPTDEITLHCQDLTIHGSPSVIPLSNPDERDVFQSYATIEDYAFMVLKLKQLLMPHQEYEVYIEFSGILGDDLVGFYPSRYLNSTNSTRYIATTHMEGPYARRVLPCFDEPSFKTTFDVQLEHRVEMQALSNGMETKTESVDDHWSRTFFETVHFMPTYLLAFIVHDFHYINVTNDHGCLIRVWCPSNLINLAPFALNVSDVVQTYFDDYLDFQYPLDKQDHIAIRDFSAGAMENWGLITYRDSRLLYGLEASVPKTSITSVITHELAHQWFGNLVTMNWWTDLWLNEGFATYMQHIGLNLVHPEIKWSQTFYIDTMDRALIADSLGSAPAIREPVYATNKDISAKFSSISYQKGGSILWMMEHFLTLDVFNRGVQNYLKERSYKNANAEHLWQKLTEADRDVGKHDVKLIMDTWTLQRGYPLVTMTRSKDGKQIEATQKIFLQLDKTLKKDEFGNLGYKWYIPLTYVYKSGPPDQYDNPLNVWMIPKTDKTTINLTDTVPDDDWYLANAKMTGLYRVNYDDTNWRRLLKQADDDPDAFSEENKIGLLYDSKNLADADIIDISIYQGFVKAFANNTLLVQDAVQRTLSYAVKMVTARNRRIQRGVNSDAIQTYMQRLVEPMYAEFGWDQSFIQNLPTSDQEWMNSQSDITSRACQYNHPHCVAKAVGMFKAYMDDPRNNAIPVNFREVVYCNGIRFSGTSMWNFAWRKLQESNVWWERSRWLSALTCSKDASLLQSYLQTYTSGTAFLDRLDAQRVLRSMADNPDGIEVVWYFLRDNWKQVKETFQGNCQLLRDIFQAMASHFRTEENLQELLDFGKNHNVDVLQYTFDDAVTSTKVNIRWMKNNAAKMQDWFNDQVRIQ